MPKPIEAVFENGVFRPLSTVDLPEHTHVQIVPAESASTSEDELTIEDRLAQIGNEASSAEWSKVPLNLSDNLDALLYDLRQFPREASDGDR
jgi:predicted DNA-binding antitoxin AbrB/MazE fold protein